MKIDVHGLRVAITAGASGIGLALAKKFVENGARVYVCDIQESFLEKFRRDFPEMGAIKTDVSRPDQVDTFIAEAANHLNGLNVLINNAGIAGPTARVEDVTPEDWDLTMAININAQFYCARRAVPLIKAAGGGSIVNMSSSAGLMGYPYRAPYAASKWAVIGLTKTMAMELGPDNIRVNAICPNAVEGPRMDRVIEAEAEAKGMTEKEVYEMLVQGTSMRTFVTTDDVAHLVLFVTSEAGCRISGQALSVDGFTETLR